MSFIFSLVTTLVALLVYLSGAKTVNERSRFTIRAIALLIGFLALFNALLKNIVVIPAGNVGVMELFGTVASRPLMPGVHIINPFSDVEQFSTRLKDLKEEIEATSREGLSFDLHVSLQYRIDPQKAAEVYQAIGSDEREIVISRFRAVVRETTANYPIEAIYAEKRQEVADRLRERMSESLTPLGFEIEDTLLREIILPDAFQAAVQEKLRAEQESLQMAFTLEQASQEADRKRVEAQGIADAQEIIARSLSDRTLQLRAIEATELLASSDNAKVLIMGGGSNGAPLLFQVDTASLSQLSP